MTDGWEEIEHTADWSIRVWASTLEGVFKQAAAGMLALLDGQIEGEITPITRRFELQDDDRETLLVDWLTELIWLIESEDALITKIDVSMPDDASLNAMVQAIPGAVFGKHIKAATYHQLDIRKTNQGYETTIVFDV